MKTLLHSRIKVSLISPLPFSDLFSTRIIDTDVTYLNIRIFEFRNINLPQ